MKDEELMLSVIMAVHETPKEYLNQAIDSILNQSYTEYEFIIIDDGCINMETIECLEEYNILDNRIKLIRNSENIGLTRSLNRALKECRGKYIARMDSDDISLPERFKTQIEYMENNPEICLCGSNTVVFDGDKIIFDESQIHSRIRRKEIADIRMLVENTGFAHSTFMIRKAFLDEHAIWYDEGLRYAQDYGLVTDIIINGGKIHRIEKVLLKYREYAGQLSVACHSAQNECQLRSSQKRLMNSFEGLSERECGIIAELPYDISHYTCNEIVSALKRMFIINRKSRLFNRRLLEQEMRYYWYKKIKHVCKRKKKVGDIDVFFALMSIPAIVNIKWEEFRLGSTL